MKDRNIEQNRETSSGGLSALDDDLERFAKKNHTQVNCPQGTYYPPVEDSLEIREISWMDGVIAKAVLIHPHSSPSGIKSDAWNFSILAWIKDAPTFEKPFLHFFLLKNAGIDTLKSNIEQLLNQSEQKLGSIKLEDIR